MAVYAFYSVIESVWLGLGRPNAAAAASGTGMAGLLVTGPALVHAMGVSGAALAFGIGSAAQLAVPAGLTILRRPLDGHVEERGTAGRSEGAPARRPVLVVAEQVTGTPDEGYERFVRAIADGLRAEAGAEGV